jgi:acyl-CoA synthetase (AMP-forming)/AMP-acid ligase II
MNIAQQRKASVLDYLSGHAELYPAREAAVEGEDRLSYKALAESVDAVASRLTDRGISLGHVVAYIGPPGIQYFISLLSAFQTNATWVGLNPKYRSDELSYVIGHARPCMIIVANTTDERTRGELALAIEKSRSDAEVVFSDRGALGLFSALSRIGPKPLVSHAAQTDIADLQASVLVYTSGSTGKPKGACLTQSNLVENAWWLARRLGFESGRFLINLPVNHAGCISDTTLVGLLNGDALVFMPTFDAVEAARLVRDEKITVLGQVPTQYQLMYAANVLSPEFLRSVKHLGWGGAAMPSGLISVLSEIVPDLFNSYGLTESSGTITITKVGATAEELAHTAGVPVFDGAVRVVDSDGLPVKSGVAGEVQICGRHVFAGYLRNDAANSQSMSTDGWLRTGDIGVLTDDGSLKLVGRMTEMYKSGGYNIYPREIEAVLESFPGVAMAAVIGIADSLWGEAGYAFVLASPEIVKSANLIALCRERLAAYKLPKTIEIRAELPMLPIGKIDRKQLANLVKSRSTDS